MKLFQSMSYLIIIFYGVCGIEEKLFFSTTSGHLKELNLDTMISRVIANHTGTVYSLAFDYKDSYLYVPRHSFSDIVRFRYPNNQTVMFERIVQTNVPLAIAFDSTNRHLYWAEDNPYRTIFRCDADGSNKTLIFNANPNYPSALTLDIVNRWIYFGEELNNGKIHRVTFDGEELTVIINIPTSYVFGIALDVPRGKIYWIERSTGDLKSAFYNGSDIRTLFKIYYNWGIALNDDFIFCASSKQILKINKSTGQNATVVHTDTHQIYGVVFIKQEGKTARIRKHDIKFIIEY